MALCDFLHSAIFYDYNFLVAYNIYIRGGIAMKNKILTFCQKYSFRIYLSLTLLMQLFVLIQYFFSFRLKIQSLKFLNVVYFLFALMILYNLFEKKHKIGVYDKITYPCFKEALKKCFILLAFILIFGLVDYIVMSLNI